MLSSLSSSSASSFSPHRRSLLSIPKLLHQHRHVSTTKTTPPPPPPPSPPFTPRTTFPVPTSLIKSYFLGHHKVGLTKMKQMVSSVELIIECRDYRVPLSSRNPLFEETLSGRERLVVYTKRDLAAEELGVEMRKTIENWHKPHRVMFSDCRDKKDVKKIIQYAQEAAKVADKLTGAKMLIVGMPNVGKSSLLNAMRHLGTGNSTKAASTGGQPGVTRKIATSVRVSDEPLVYLIDSPGVFVPYMPNPHTMLNLALVGCIKDSLLPPLTVADYLLYHINLRNPSLYSHYHSSPTNDIYALLAATAIKTGKLHKGGVPDLETTAGWLVNRYREGKLGRFILDEVREGAYGEWVEREEAEGESESAGRKRVRGERRERARKKNSREEGEE